jgi:RNA polymerase sigma factor (sigma-70 family)
MESFVTDADVLRESLSQPAMFAALYERHAGAVSIYLIRRVGNGIAEDLTAEVFVRAFRARATYDVRHDTALPWLLGIASNLIADHRRAERRRLAAVERLARTTPAFAPDRHAVELGAELARALRRLPAVDRDTLLLVVWGELSYEEVAVALGVPVGTVRSRISRARKRLAGTAGVQRDSIRSTEVQLKGETHA